MPDETSRPVPRPASDRRLHNLRGANPTQNAPTPLPRKTSHGLSSVRLSPTAPRSSLLRNPKPALPPMLSPRNPKPPSTIPPASLDSPSTADNKKPRPASANGDMNFTGDTCIISDNGNTVQAKSCESLLAETKRDILSRLTSDNFQRPHSRAIGRSRPSSIGPDYHSLDDNSLSQLAAAKKAAAFEMNAQRKLKALEYGRKPGKACRVAPDAPSLMPVNAEPQRCKFVTAQSDPLCVAYHDQEWGVPVHNDRNLFELLVLAGAQAELSWTTILHKREVYRDIFRGYDPAVVASFRDEDIQSLESDKTLLLSSAKVRGVVENARRALQVVKEFGSLDTYFWSFFNYKPIIKQFRYPKQLPAKTSKSELISKDLVKRGFRFVGPTIVYAFMQAAGMTNDHLVQCFRHKACMLQAGPTGVKSRETEVFSGLLNGMEIDLCHMLVDVAFHADSEVPGHGLKPHTHNLDEHFVHTELVRIEAY